MKTNYISTKIKKKILHDSQTKNYLKKNMWWKR